MKRHTVIATILLGILAFFIWRGCQKPSEWVGSPIHPPGPVPGRTILPQKGRPATREEHEDMVREKCVEFAKNNNVPIAFYGRMVDQDGRVLQGVAVELIVTSIPKIPVPWGPDETTKVSCVTDQNGLFSIEGKRGTGLDVGFSKQGYRKSGYYKQAHVHYDSHSTDRHIPDRNKPVEFMLIRDDLARAEKVFDQRLRFNWNAGPLIEDLGPDIGKFEITATRTGRDSSNTLKKFEWEARVRAMGFTLVKLSDKNERMAPLTGYLPNCRVGFSPSEKTWSSEDISSYAILTDGGSYGLMELTIYGDGDDGGLGGQATIYLNKGGSRNLDHK